MVMFFRIFSKSERKKQVEKVMLYLCKKINEYDIHAKSLKIKKYANEKRDCI